MSEPLSISAVSKPSSIAPPAAMVHGDPCTLVIFGAAGDLAQRKLFPAIYHLAKKGLLADDFRIVGVGIESLDDAAFRARMRAALDRSDDVRDVDGATWADVEARLFWLTGNLTEPTVYAALRARLESLETNARESTRNRLFYLAVPPQIFPSIVLHLGESGAATRVDDPGARPWRRLIVEKPFGHDLASAEALSRGVLAHFAEHQIYRIDHYVGKETVQNVLVLRSANAIFETLWSRANVSHVEVTAAETVGLEGRAGYYEKAGVVRDMFQNHLLQCVALAAMEPPREPTANAVRDEKVKVLRAVRPLVDGGRASAIHAQYAHGTIGEKEVAGYREEPGVDPRSVTPTYAALRLYVDNHRWQGVPFYVRSGKRMKKRVSEVALHFRAPQRLMYEPVPTERLAPNVLVLRIQPDDGVALGFTVKVPGAALALTPGIEVQEVRMNFDYADAFGAESHPAYETLLLDCMIGDATLFTRTDEVEAAWRIVDPLLEHWAARADDAIPTYAAGTWGPPEADDFIAHDGHAWRTP